MPDIILPGTIRPQEEPADQATTTLTGDEVLALEKQQLLTDTLVTGRAELDADRLFSDAFDHLLEEVDPSDPDFVTRSDMEATRIEYRVTDALPEGVSDTARRNLARNLARRREGFERDVDVMRGTARTRGGLALVEDFAGRAAETVRKAPFRLKTSLEQLDRVSSEVGQALVPLREPALQERRATIVTAAIKGMVEAGQGDKAQLLLQSGVLDDRLGEDRVARLAGTAKALTDAHDRDTEDRTQRKVAAATRAHEASSLNFTADVRRRLSSGTAMRTEIATAEADGILTVSQAKKLQAELEAARKAQELRAAPVDRIASVLNDGGHLEPADPGDRADAGRHYAAVFKPALADMDAAGKAAAIRGYIENTGIAPDDGLRTLAALTATGDTASRIEAARHLTASFVADPAARARVPAALGGQADLMVQLADLDAIDPAEIVRLADTQSGDGTPALIQLAQSRNDSSVQTDGPPDTLTEASETEGTSDTPPVDVSASPDETDQNANAERDNVELVADDDDGQAEEDADLTGSALYRGIQDRLSETTDPTGGERPTGRLGPGLDAAENANRARQGSVKPVDPLLGEFVGLLNPTVRGAITVTEGAKGFDAYRDMTAAQARGDQKAADEARDRMVGALLAAVPGGRIFQRGKAANAGITEKAPAAAETGPRLPDKAATTGGGRENQRQGRQADDSKFGGRGQKAKDSSKAEKHGDENALTKIQGQIEQLEKEKANAKSRKQRRAIQFKINRIRRTAEKSRSGTLDSRRGNPMKGGR